MAGFLGFFDYNKPGPGVDKHGPKKKSFVVFFEIYFRKFWKLIIANLLYVLVSIPVVTKGLAEAGLTYITRNFAREKHAFISSDFFDTIKKNWKQALPIGIINLIATVILVFDLYFFFVNTQGFMSYIMLAIIFTIYIVFTFMKYYMSMMMITFKLSIKQLYKNSLIFAFAGLKQNLFISLILILCYAIGFGIVYLLNYIGIVVLLMLYIFVFPAFRSLLIQYTIFPLIKKHMIDPYYKEHPDEDKEAKRALNIEEEDPEEDELAVFQDTGRTDKEEDEGETESKKPARNLPKQYNEQELRKHKIYRRARTDDDDDDGTI